MFGVSVKLPFRFQFFSSHWIDFPFVDQLEISARVCSLVALSKTEDDLQFSVLGADAVCEIILNGGTITSIKLIRVQPLGVAAHFVDVRVVEVGDFFVGMHISFAETLLPSTSLELDQS